MYLYDVLHLQVDGAEEGYDAPRGARIFHTSQLEAALRHVKSCAACRKLPKMLTSFTGESSGGYASSLRFACGYVLSTRCVLCMCERKQGRDDVLFQ